MFYEIKITVWHGNEHGSTKSISYIKKRKLFFKKDLIEEAKKETDSRIINQLNHFYKDCQFDFMKAYHKYGVTFNASAKIINRITGKRSTVYYVTWVKNYWDLNIKQYIDDKLELH